MVLEDVHLNDPHVAAHNAERHVINMLSGVVRTPEAYGAVGDGVVDDTAEFQAAIDDTSALGGGVIMLGSAKRYKVAGIVLKSGVLITTLGGEVKWAGGPKAATILPADGYTGWIIDSPATNIKAAGVIGVNINGNVTGAASPNTGGIRIQDGTWCTVDSCSIAATSLGCINMNGTAHIVRNNGCQNFWQYRGTLTVDEGVITLTGTDYRIEANQTNGGMGLQDAVGATIPDLHKCGMLLTLYTSWVQGGNCEFSEVAWRITAFESLFNQVRADTNPGIGFHIKASGGGGTQYRAIQSFANCLSPQADTIHPGILVEDNNCDFDGILLGPDWTGTGAKPEYGIKETTSKTGWVGRDYISFNNRYRNVRWIHTAAASAFRRDLAVDTTLRPFDFMAFDKPGAGSIPSLRPASRFSLGGRFYDTTTKISYVSNGSKWEVTGPSTVVGEPGVNLIPAACSALINQTVPFGQYGGTAKNVAYAEDSTFGKCRVVAFKATPTGVTATYAGILASSSVGIATGIVAGRKYQIGFFAKGPTGKNPQAIGSIVWLDAANVALSTVSAMTAVPIAQINTANLATPCMGQAVTAPANAVKALILIGGQATGLADDDIFRISTPTITQVEGGGAALYTEPIEP